MKLKLKFSNLFKPAPLSSPLKDPKIIDEQYSYWRLRIVYSMYLGYVVYYFTRKSFTFAMPVLAKDLGFSMSDLGILGTVFYISYGFSKFTSAIISDRSNPRYFMAIGLIMTGVINLIFSGSSQLGVFIFLWCLNGFFQGWGWAPCTKNLTYWFSKKERGFWWSVTSTSHNLGGALIPIITAFCCSFWGWRSAMIVPGIIAILLGLWLMNRLRDVPQTLGLPPIENYKNKLSNVCEEIDAKTDQNILSPSQILFRYVLNQPAVWVLAFSYFFVYIVRTAVNDWGAIYLVKEKQYSLIAASASISWFEVGGFFGVLAAGYFSDRFFRGRRITYMVYCAVGLGFALTTFWYVPAGFIFLDSILMSMIGFLIFGPQLLVGLCAAEFVDKKAACTANGFAGSFAYIGAAFTGYPLGKIIDEWDWQGFFVVITIAAFFIFAILLPLSLRISKTEKIKAYL